jgi:hypoxanthine phosphoribosyltransferase
MQKVILTNKKLFEAIYDVARKARLLKADAVVAIERGGLPLATFLSAYLNLPLERIRVSFYKDTEKQKIPIVDLKDFDITIYKKPMFVDDLVDSGDTLKYIKATYGNVPYVTLCASETITPDVFSFIKDKNEGLVFPWDTPNDGFDYKFAEDGWWKNITI